MTSVGLKNVKPVFKTKPKLNQVDKLIARTRAQKALPVKGSASHTNLACCVNEALDDPFEKAMRENEKIIAKIKEDQLRLAEFKKNVKTRLKVYKHVEHKIDEDDRQLKIDKSRKLSFSSVGNKTATRAKSADFANLRSVSVECFHVDRSQQVQPAKTQAKPIEKLSN
jgi:hypothetical protein